MIVVCKCGNRRTAQPYKDARMIRVLRCRNCHDPYIESLKPKRKETKLATLLRLRGETGRRNGLKIRSR